MIKEEHKRLSGKMYGHYTVNNLRMLYKTYRQSRCRQPGFRVSSILRYMPCGVIIELETKVNRPEFINEKVNYRHMTTRSINERS